MRLKNKVAIVIGAAHGMGEAEARLFAKEGAKVVLADVPGDLAEIAAADIRAGSSEAMAATIGVTNEAQWVALIEKTVARYGRLDILVNNAGISGSAVATWMRSPAGTASSRSIRQASFSAPNSLPSRWRRPTEARSSTSVRSWGLLAGRAVIPPTAHQRGAVRISRNRRQSVTGPLGVRVNSVHPGYMLPMLNATYANERVDKIA